MVRPKLEKACMLCGRIGLVTSKGYCHACAAHLKDSALKKYIDMPAVKMIGVHVFADSYDSGTVSKTYMFSYPPGTTFREALDESTKDIETRKEKITRMEIYEEN